MNNIDKIAHDLYVALRITLYDGKQAYYDEARKALGNYEEYNQDFQHPKQTSGDVLKMAEDFADTCFVHGSFRWGKVVQYYLKGISDYRIKLLQEAQLESEKETEGKPSRQPYSDDLKTPIAGHQARDGEVEEWKEEFEKANESLQVYVHLAEQRKGEVEKLVEALKRAEKWIYDNVESYKQALVESGMPEALKPYQSPVK